MTEQLDRIRKAYDLSVEEYNQGIDPFALVPEEFRNSHEFKALMEDGEDCNMGNPDIREYLDPQPGMKFLDAGCGAGLLTYRLHEWPSLYHGVDISPKLIEAMRGFVKREGIKIGGLWVRDLSSLPFTDGYFDIAASVGVLEYYGLTYINQALKELNRVIKPKGRLVLDIPNQTHPNYPVMTKVEKYLGRPHVPFTRAEFEGLFCSFFAVQKVNDSKEMCKYLTAGVSGL